MRTPSAKLILLAAAPESRAILSKALPPEFECDWCSTVEEAQKLLKRRYDLIVCCTLFDSSRMFDLLRYCKAEPEVNETPFLCLRAVCGTFEDTAFQAVEIACKSLGAAGFVDVFKLTAKLGHEKTLERVTGILTELVNQNKSRQFFKAS